MEENNPLEDVERILDKLIENAEALNSVAEENPQDDKLGELQKNQEELLEELKDIDKKNTANPNMGSVSREATARLTTKLRKFQQLNTSFIEKLSKGQKGSDENKGFKI